MNLSRWSRIAEWAVLAAVAGLHALLMLLPEPVDQFPGFLAMAGRQTLALGQPAVLLAWAVLGPGRWWWRWPAAAVSLVGVALWWGELPNPSRWENGDALFAAFVIAAFALLCLLRSFGLSVRGTAEQHEPRAQFSIRTLLIATTLIAGVIGVLEYLRPALAETQMQEVLTFGFPGGIISLPNETFTATALRASVLGAASAALAVGAIFVVLRPGLVWLRAIVLLTALPALAGYLIHLIGVSDSSLSQRIAELTCAFAALAAMTAVTVLPLRLFGYRLSRPATATKTTTAPASSNQKATLISENAA
jgi:hypothetical protein